MDFGTTLLTHKISVWIFLLLFIIKLVLLLTGRKKALSRFTKTFRVPDMIVSTLFLASGTYLWVELEIMSTWLVVKVLLVIASIPLAVIGFKKQNKILALISLLLLLTAYRFAETKQLSFKKEKKFSAPESAGKVVFNDNCARCHGADGKLAPGSPMDLSLSQKTTDQKISIITNGDDDQDMPAFKDKLSPEQVRSVAEYTELFKQ